MLQDIILQFTSSIIEFFMKKIKYKSVIILIGVIVFIIIFLVSSVTNYKILDESLRADNGHFYEISFDSYYWDEAKKECNNQLGHLVTITSSTEQAIVASLPKSNYSWIGANRIGTSNNWCWVTNERFEYDNFQYPEPNNYKNVENVVVILDDGTWNDVKAKNPYNNNEKLPYICEWEHKYNFIITIGKQIHEIRF